MRRAALAGVAAAACAVLGSAASAERPVAPSLAAEAQYRIARRLVVEGSPQAEAALRRVLELDPRGPLADDALVDLARLSASVAWPEELGRLEPEGVQRALEILAELRREHPQGDRLPEARLDEALLRLAPLPSRDAEAARLMLLEIATLHPGTPLSERARYALAWMAEQWGALETARDAYTRLVVDAAEAPTAQRAAAGLARVVWRTGDAGAAAVWADRAFQAQRPDERAAVRELAVRRVLVGSGTPAWARGKARRFGTALRSPDRLAALPEGWLVGDSREGRVVEFDTGGARRGEWSVAGLLALAVDAFGRLFAATEGELLQLLPGQRVRRILEWPESWREPRALAVGADGSVWIADRRGQRVARLEPTGAAAPILEQRDARVTALAWDGRTLLALDAREGQLWGLVPGQSPRVLARVEGRPGGLAASALGLVVWSEREGAVEKLRVADPQGVWPTGHQREASPGAVALAVSDDGTVAWLLEGGGLEVVP